MEYIRKYDIPSERIANIEFAEEEKSEEDRRFSAYQSVYEQLAKTKRDREEVLEKKQRTEITGKLSSEMEEELKKIASEKGLKYDEYKPETVDDGYMKTMSDDDVDLIRQAEEYIKNKTISEIQIEHDEIDVSYDDDANETFSFDDNHPLVRDSFEERFQPFSKKIVEEIKPNVVVYEENIEAEDADTHENVAQNSTSASAYEQLSSSSSKLQAFKDVMASGNKAETEETVSAEDFDVQQQKQTQAQTRQVFKKVEPENFMESITQTKLVSGNKPVEVPVQQEQKNIQRKPISQRVGRKGGFIAVDGILGDRK